MFFVVRHGERADHAISAEENARVQNTNDPPLTALGLEHAAKAGEFIRDAI
jgi:broad specificity phosphatase PhoE